MTLPTLIITRLDPMQNVRLFFILALLALTGCASSLPQSHKLQSFSESNYEDTWLYNNAKNYMQQNESSGFYPLGNAQAAFISRLALIQNAQKTLDIQYYIYTNDDTGNLFTWYLYEAAERGVRVRLLLDDNQTRDDNTLASLSAHPNIEIRLFNPFSNRTVKTLGFVHDFSRVNRRMHNKAVIADGAFAITGGRNIADEYFSANRDLEFSDLDLLLIGDVVPKVATQFDAYWNSKPAVAIESIVDNVFPISDKHTAYWKKLQQEYLQESAYIQSLEEHDFVKMLRANQIPFHMGEISLSYDDPEKVLTDETTLLIEDLTREIKKAKNEFILVSPYFVPTKEGTERLIKMVEKGIDVIIVTNSLASNDVFAVHGWYAKYREDLIKGGVKLYETKVRSVEKIDHSLIGLTNAKASLHAKSFIIDKHKIFVGSFNFDPRSAYYNTELGVFVDSPQFAEFYIKHFEKLIAKTTYKLSLDDRGDIVWHDTLNNTVYEKDPYSSLMLRGMAALSGILPVEKLL